MRGTFSHERMAAMASCKIVGQDQAHNIPAWIVGDTGSAISAEAVLKAVGCSVEGTMD